MELRGVDKYFGDLAAVEQMDLAFEEGDFFTLVGPSGSGKTTLIRMLAGMQSPTHGDILLRGERINERPANQRPTCMVFQSLALFPHMTVGGNVEYPLKCKRSPWPNAVNAQHSVSSSRICQCHITTALSRPARAVNVSVSRWRGRLRLIRRFCFFVELLSAIDYRLRKTLEKEIKDIQRETGKTFVYITHSLEEAMVMSDRIGVMHEGRLAQIGTPHEIYTEPVDRFVSEFMGEVNSIPVKRSDDGQLRNDELGLTVTPQWPLNESFESGTLIVRPENMRLLNDDETDTVNELTGEIFNEYLLGSRIQFQLRSENHTFLVECMRESGRPGAGESVRFGWTPAESMLFPE